MAHPSHVLAETPEVDLAVLAAEVEELEAYIIKGDVYRTLRVQTPSGTQMVQMSGGDLLTRLYRLEGEREQLAVELRAQVKDLAMQVRSIIYSLRTRAHDLLAREVKTRIDSLNWFLDDVMGDPKRARTEFPYEMRNRQRIAVMVDELGDDFTPELKAELKRVDDRIRLIAKPYGFLWDSRLEPLFPRERFWYLYVSP